MATMSINANYHDINNGAAGLHSRYCWIYMSNSSYYRGKNDIQFVLLAGWGKKTKTNTMGRGVGNVV